MAGSPRPAARQHLPAEQHRHRAGPGRDEQARPQDGAFAHAALHRLGVVAVHAYRWRIAGHYVEGLREEPVRLLAEAVAGYRGQYPDVPVRRKVVQGESAQGLVTESAGAALTVVGSRGRGGFSGLLLGSTSQGVPHHATGPVAVVRAQATRGGTATRTISAG
ncbi:MULTISPECIES: universal stress protein [unclassified Nonomuraea]|uniref:universal stress protein n=1 Tax=unclassified Nonomuraea TaxID=2593643 RepID=UPI0033FCF24A